MNTLLAVLDFLGAVALVVFVGLCVAAVGVITVVHVIAAGIHRAVRWIAHG